MMKKIINITVAALLLAIWLYPGPSVFASQLAEPFLKGIAQYKNGDYAASIAAFKQIANAGVKNGELFYNLGNAYLKNGDLGEAIQWYERALKYNPWDPDLKFNLAQAQSKITDEMPARSNPIFRVLLFWKHLLGPTAVKWLAVISSLLFWIIMSVNRLYRKYPFKTTAVTMALISAILCVTALYDYYEAAHIRYGIILPKQAAIRSGLTDNATVLFNLHAGTKVKVEREQDNHLRITFTEDKIGWIERSKVGII